MSGIDQLYRAGDDALQNLFEINISPISFITGIDFLKVRVLDFAIGDTAISTYTSEYKTQTMEKFGGKIETATDFSFNIRLDKYWVLYESFRTWLNYIGDSNTGLMAEDVGVISGTSSIRTDISVWPVDSGDNRTGIGWKFIGAAPKSLSGVSFDHGSGDPIEVEVSWLSLKQVPNI